MKLLLLISVTLISSQRAFANFTFQCVGNTRQQLNARMVISAKTRIEQRNEEVCNGGVGDPMVCQNIVRIYKYKKAYIEIGTDPNRIRTVANIQKMTWNGSDPNDFFDFYGDSLAGNRRIEVHGYSGYPTDFVYEVKLFAPGADRCDVNTCLILRCRLAQ